MQQSENEPAKDVDRLRPIGRAVGGTIPKSKGKLRPLCISYAAFTKVMRPVEPIQARYTLFFSFGLGR